MPQTICYLKTSYFLAYSYSKKKIEVKLDLSNVAAKYRLKNEILDTSQFAKMRRFRSL